MESHMDNSTGLPTAAEKAVDQTQHECSMSCADAHKYGTRPAVTVFMPVHNALPYLSEAVESIRRQTLREWDFLIVDDGSTDGSLEYLRGLNDPRIRILSQPHQGPAVAANWALELCETEYFARIDADDVAHPTRLAEQLAFLREHPEVGLLGTQIRPLGQRCAGRPSSLAIDHKTIFASLMQGKHAMCNPTIMCRTAVLREIGGYHADGALEDWAMFLSMGERSQLANLDRVLLSYRIHSGSTNNRHMAELRTRIAFVCDRARRRQLGQPCLEYDEFLFARRAEPIWRRAVYGMEGHAMGQYRRAMVDILGSHRLRGYARLAWSAACSPPLTFQRIGRVVRKRLSRHDGNDVAQNEATQCPCVKERPSQSDKSVWPPKYNVLGVQVSATNYDEATGAIIEAAKQREPAVVSLHAVHALITASGDRTLRTAVNTFDMIGPDGQPVRWALNLLHRARLRDRVYGPELMLRVCSRAADDGVPIYLYGSSRDTLKKLEANLIDRYPALRIVGVESPPFRDLTPDEEDGVLRRIDASGAGIVFVGLGAPKQDLFAHRHRHRIRGVQVCVGAAFDFHAGKKQMAPPWMQRRGLEWLFRLVTEPRRLWRRYLVTNSLFLGKLAVAFLRRDGRSAEGTPRPALEAADAMSSYYHSDVRHS